MILFFRYTLVVGTGSHSPFQHFSIFSVEIHTLSGHVRHSMLLQLNFPQQPVTLIQRNYLFVNYLGDHSPIGTTSRRPCCNHEGSPVIILLEFLYRNLSTTIGNNLWFGFTAWFSHVSDLWNRSLSWTIVLQLTLNSTIAHPPTRYQFSPHNWSLSE